MSSPSPRWVALRSSRDIEGIDRAARVARSALRSGLSVCRPGTTTNAVCAAAREEVIRLGGRPAFEGYRPEGAPRPFPAAACVCVNEEVVHAVPGERELLAGDLVTVDVGVECQGWFGDVARSIVVPGVEAGVHNSLRLAARRAVALGARACVPGARWSEVADVVRETAAESGCEVLAGFSGHGVGGALHEPPRAGFGIRPGVEDDFVLWPGMVLTIEPIVLSRPSGVVTLEDGWTVRTRDGSSCCHEERVVAITRRGPRILGLGTTRSGESRCL